MNGIFRIDGPFYRFGNILYYLIVLNLLWFISSIPIFTIGASTTALFYVMGKVVRDEDVKVLSHFFKSFRLNFKQSTVIWLVFLAAYTILFVNIKNIEVLKAAAKYMLPLQMAALIELVIVNIYIFPMLSRYEMGTINLFKLSFLIGNKHLISTLFCIGSLAIILLLLYRFPGIFALFPVSLYALCSYFIIQNIFKKYMLKEEDGGN